MTAYKKKKKKYYELLIINYTSVNDVYLKFVQVFLDLDK